jgi:spore coat protein U domain-containing protein, fimbrial subunit CupE1/2/3/6
MRRVSNFASLRTNRIAVSVAAILLTCSSSRAYALLQSCSVSATALSFGAYDPSSATPRDSTGTVTVTCTTLVGVLSSWDILLSTGSSGSFTPRRLLSGGDSMQYNLYTDVGRTQVWGDATGITAKVSDSRSLTVGTNQYTYTTYGRIPALQNLATGTYTDTITVTLNYQ